MYDNIPVYNMYNNILTMYSNTPVYNMYHNTPVYC